LTYLGLNLDLESFRGSTQLSMLCGESVCLSRSVQVTGAAWQTAMRIMAGVGDLVQRTRDDQAQVGYEEHGFLVSASKPRSAISPSLASKPLVRIFRFGTDSCGLVISPRKSP
jgi:hypothetical protein